ncbi:MAG: carbohydrate ABC transporter permease [Hungatella hathewayi]|nr:carbohydrate ABC transporter permease [Hungatella hathewayi]MBS5063854.1 carbohydrate ABC transporter permease [Hungatella hathewayi]
MFLYAALALGAVTSLLPFLWMLSGSLKSNNELFAWPIQWIPANPRFQNFKDVLTQIPFVTYFLNTLKLSVINTSLQVITCSLAAYAFSKIEFPGRDKLFLVYLGTMMVPFHVTMIPQYMIMNQLKLTNTHLALILIQAFSPFGVFLLRQFFVSIPGELSEAARIDGCSEFMILFRIILPLAKGALATLITFTFTFVWNDYLGPMIYLHKDSIRTIQIGLRVFQTTNGVEYNLILAGTVMGLLPLLIVYFTCQKYFTQSVTATGLKG